MPKSRISPQVREFVRLRANDQCEYCLYPSRYPPDPLTVDHIPPLADHGVSEPANLAYCRQGCNGHKYTATSAFDYVTGRDVRLYNPRTQNWADHFEWNEDNEILIGVSPVGRTTIERLQLNRFGLIAMRRVQNLIEKLSS
jgi:hypothetical protein